MESYDVVIVGSGYGGSVNAARLAEGGMRVLVLERGPRLRTADLLQSDDPRHVASTIDLVVSSSNVAFRTGKMVGGASVQMDGAHFRVPTKSFAARDATGRRYWPEALDRAALDPYYARAEAMLSIRQIPWDEISKSGGLFAKMCDLAGATCDRARMNYADCLHCGFCATGCIYDKKRTMLHTYLPLAEALGAEVRAGCAVDHVAPDGAGYTVAFTSGGVAETVRGERVIVAGGGIHSAALLLRSRPHLPGLSAHVGENFNNNGEHPFVGVLPEGFDDLDRYQAYKGSDNAMVMCFHWYESEGITLHPGGGLEPSLFAADLSAPAHPVLPSKAFGLDYKRFVERVYPHRVVAFSALGLADGHRAIVLRADGTPDFAERDRAATDAYLDRLEAIVAELGARSGVTIAPATSRELAGTTSTHLLSACRMADRVEDGVTDADLQVFGHENLYVCDASSIPWAIAVNPALTITALAERCAERILARG